MPTESATKPPGSQPQKPERYRAEMPQIPGVAGARPGPSTVANEISGRRLMQIGGLAAAILLTGILVLWWMKRAPHDSTGAPGSDIGIETSVTAPAGVAGGAAENDGPVVAATLEEMTKPWSANKFVFVKPFSKEKLDAMVIRLPGGGLWAFALMEPYGRCDLEFVTDPSQIARQYGYRASHPMVASPCSNTVYDPLKVGAIGDNVLVRGEIVRGSGLRPPISIDVVENGRSIIADGIE